MRKDRMNAQNVIGYINKINKYGIGDPKFGMVDENTHLFNEIYDIARAIEPSDWYRGGEDRCFWIWADKGSYEEYVENYTSDFTYYDNFDDAFDKINGHVKHEEMKSKWSVLFPDNIVWFQIYLAEFEERRSLWINGKRIISTEKNGARLGIDMEPLLRWIIEEEHKIIKMIADGTYSDFVSKNLPYKYRLGYTNMETYWKYVPEAKERLFGKINPEEFKEFIAWDRYSDIGWSHMSSKDYFDICNGLYDILGLKIEYPVKNPDEMTPKKYYMAYAAMCGSVRRFLELEETSVEAFEKFVTEDQTEHHTWEVCLVPNIHLYPRRVNGKMYVFLSFDHKVDDYEKLVHLCLEMKKKGFPILKPSEVEERMDGKRYIWIKPEVNSHDYGNERKTDMALEIHESGMLPEDCPQDFIDEITWFPTNIWSLETEDNRIKGECPNCCYDKTKIIYHEIDNECSVKCPQCGFQIDEKEAKDKNYEDVFRYWNVLSYRRQA